MYKVFETFNVLGLKLKDQNKQIKRYLSVGKVSFIILCENYAWIYSKGIGKVFTLSEVPNSGQYKINVN